MIFLSGKNKLNSVILIVLITFFTANYICFAQTEVYDRVVRDNTASIKTNTEGIWNETNGIKTNTQSIIVNTETLITNAEEIAAILSGENPGAQYDNIKSREMLVETKLLLRQMTQSITNFANSGSNGNPFFITNTGVLLQTTRDGVINDYLTKDKALDSLCPTFKNQVKVGIGQQYNTFEKKVACTFPDSSTFTNGDFVQGGGWDAWLKLTTVPQNNPLGAMIIADAELQRRIENQDTITKLEATWGNGFLSWKDCSDKANANPDRGYDGCTTKTPASVIANKVYAADASSMRELEAADQFNSLAYIASQKASQYSSTGSLSSTNNGLLGSGSGRGTLANSTAVYNQMQTYINSLNNNNGGGNNNGGNGSTTPEIIDNLDGAKAAINNLLAIENSNLAAQTNIYNLLETVKNVFASSTTCSAAVKKEINDQVTGNYTGVKSLKWNMTDITNLVNNNIANSRYVLTTALTQVSAPGLSDITIAAIVGNLPSQANLSTTADVASYSAPGGTDYLEVKNWVQDKVTANKTACNINTSLFSTWGIQ